MAKKSVNHITYVVVEEIPAYRGGAYDMYDKTPVFATEYGKKECI